MPGTPVDLIAADGHHLAATRFAPEGEAHGSIVVAGATAVPQRFYRRFAEYSAGRGYDVLTLDYRGTGGSRPESLRGYRMNYADWARLDIPAAIEAQSHPDRHPDRPLFVVGHSYGGAAFGLVPNHDRVTGVYAFGAGAGWHGWMPRLERLRVLALWHLIGPPLTATLGYLPWSRVMAGEDLPTDAFRDWKRWCSFPHFVLDDPRHPEARGEYASVRTPMVLANSTDDPWSPPRSRDAIATGYSNAPVRAVDIDPGAGMGHMGYFRATSQPLWDDVLAEFETRR